jgi:hypothetical protein
VLGRALFRISTQLFGGRMTPPEGDWREEEAEPERRLSNGPGEAVGAEGVAQGAAPETAPAPRQPVRTAASQARPQGSQGHPAAEAARILERALNEAETILGKLERSLRSAPPAPEREDESMTSQELNELRRDLRSLTGRLDEALARLTGEIERLAGATQHLTSVIARIETQPAAMAPAPPEGPGTFEEPAPAAPREPRFEPGEEALGVVVGAVPGFQGLMDVQRGLSGLPAVAGAPVRRYKNGEALLEVALREPLSVTQIVRKLETTTGRSMLIEEARPEALRLRLRFTDGDGTSTLNGDR